MTTFQKLIKVAVGLILTSLGIKLLSANHLTFGGTAGIASVLTYASSYSWGLWFFIVNLPFFFISLQKIGRWFTISSLLSIMGISIIRDSLDFIVIPSISPVYASLTAGVLIGIGVTLVLNHGSSLGGIHILALYLDTRFKINRGFTIFISDFLIILSAGVVVGWGSALVSILSIVVASGIIGRYRRSPIRNVNKEEEFESYSVSNT